MNFEEIRDFGYNVKTIIFFITIILTLLNVYLLNKQRKKIIKEGAKSVSFLFFSYLGSAAFSAVIYAMLEGKLGLLINGICVGLMALIISGEVIISEKILFRDKVIGLGLSPLIIPWIAWAPARHDLFFILGLVLVAALWHQIIEVIKKKSIGSLHYGPVIYSIFSSSFWLIYSFLFAIWPMEINNSFFVFSWLVLGFCVYKYRNKRELIAK